MPSVGHFDQFAAQIFATLRVDETFGQRMLRESLAQATPTFAGKGLDFTLRLSQAWTESGANAETMAQAEKTVPGSTTQDLEYYFTLGERPYGTLTVEVDPGESSTTQVSAIASETAAQTVAVAKADFEQNGQTADIQSKTLDARQVICNGRTGGQFDWLAQVHANEKEKQLENITRYFPVNGHTLVMTAQVNFVDPALHDMVINAMNGLTINVPATPATAP